MSIARIQPNGRLSQAVAHAQTVYLTGQVGVEDQSIEEQTRSVLASIDRLLAAAGTDKSRILQAIVWLADRRDFAGMNAVWDKWVDPTNPPARSTGQMALLEPGLKVEITIVAATS
ncbi:RidA family protein [Bosea sp. BK604]|uniref:RidA family protein n=1 Tax=Bosea sp. BK604 TaxID=2512180 RepID=UPI0010492EC1|nr:RidA family protein [Bosea sp. BK604]TCR61807.1 enamine deaminase RidA (YjgF/YER057c/UK114 family) [Bosea sp. BK604]